MSSNSFFNQMNQAYLEERYESFKKDPDSVDASLKYFFLGFDAAREEITVDKSSGEVRRSMMPLEFFAEKNYHQTTFRESDTVQEIAFQIIAAYREHGHLEAKINPLVDPEPSKFLNNNTHGLLESDMDTQVSTANLPLPEKMPIKDLIAALRAMYCDTIAVEYVGVVQEVDEFNWVKEQIEVSKADTQIDPSEREWIYKNIYKAAAFEQFLHKKFVGQKRFSLEGLDSMIPALHGLVDEFAKLGGTEVVLGMAHRGRLNVLANLLHKPYSSIISEFLGNHSKQIKGDGDVKYHLGYTQDVTTLDGRVTHVSLNPNPSHLELVNPVIQGRVYSRQKLTSDIEKDKIVSVIIHGDAAVSGQGINMEMLQLSQLKGYAVGGTIHIIADNQIGFTAFSKESRSTRYPSDLFQMVHCPIFHANADDPEACVRALRLAVKYRMKFKKDVVVHLVGYRRYGHNEGDEPSFTQPLMYKDIKAHTTAQRMYKKHIVDSQLLEKSKIDEIEKIVDTQLENDYERVQSNQTIIANTKEDETWQDYIDEDKETRITGVSIDLLKQITELVSKHPSDFNANKKITKFLAQRVKLFEEDKIDWAFAETLAFGSLLVQKHNVRLSGQDSRRGTFTQRHQVVYDSKSGEEYIPINHLSDDQKTICVFNSMLSELAVLGFEYGFSLSNPNALNIWEAQFGDFVNGAQAMIDQFIVSAESKWKTQSGLVMMLPHGYEGQGPEHSSARLERFLQQCADYNMRVCNTTTPANYFHVLRRQVVKRDRKPLILMTPKVLLRLKACTSTKDDFSEDKIFLKIIAGEKGQLKSPKSLTRLIFCSGKLYYELADYLTKNDIKDIEIVRLEQLYPFPDDVISEVIKTCTSLKEVYWVQEERKNMGAWTFVEPRFTELFEGSDLKIKYVGRTEGSSPCTGYAKVHKEQQAQLIAEAFTK
ncbi:MAG: 2-oxoglutarate dehydrogenase E1 component [Candidatus Cloacimonetes bacterium]|nr:2-oxoglutarate dehydrogenase E1 component [Candidatus Cloacimonadota bacterium]